MTQFSNPFTNPYSRSEYINALFGQLANRNPSSYVTDWAICWTQFESTAPNAASFNLLNTTQPETGSYGGGSQGNIQYYPDLSTGILGLTDTLANGNYPTLINALANNDQATLAMAGSNQIAQELTTWGTGHASDIVSCANTGGARPNDTFTYDYAPPGGTTTPPGTTPPGSNPLGGTSPTIGIGINPFQPIIDWFNSLQPLWDWLGNPARMLKMVGGLLLLGVALTMLVAPQAIDEVKKHPEILIGA